VNNLRDLERQFRKGLISKEAFIAAMHERHLVLWEYLKFINDRNISSIDVSNDDVIFRTRNGIKITCDPLDSRATPFEIFNFGDYEASEIAMVDHFLRPDSVILDIGANIGWYSLNLSKKVARGKVFAFEPLPKIFSRLMKNIKLNNVENVRPLNFGLSNKAGSVAFFFNPKLWGATSAAKLHEKSKTARVTCKLKRLDDFIFNLTDRIDFIKCDVEGAEKFVIEGGLEAIRKTLPAIFLEMLRKWSAKFGYHPNDIITILSGLGYQCFFIDRGKLIRIDKITEKTAETNFFFLHPGKHSRVMRKLVKGGGDRS
jgi:FkbM family methyltransferase